MQVSDFPMSALFLIFLALFLLIGTSPALHRWLDRVVGMGKREDEAGAGKPGDEAESVKVPTEAPGEMSRQAKDYEAIVFQQLALAGEKGLSLAGLADELHFDPPMVARSLISLERKGMIRQSGFLGRRFRLSAKGREHAVQEGLIPRLRSGGG